LAQQHGERWVVVNPPALPLSTGQMDAIYDLEFARRYHPVYEEQGGIPALEPVQFSVTTHRGCFGGCAFCSLGLHQGKFIQNRSIKSIVQEVEAISRHPDFKGSIPDVGAASANMFGLRGKDEQRCQSCRRKAASTPQYAKIYRPTTAHQSSCGKNCVATNGSSICLWPRAYVMI
jgi:uncharacterized radical SAM protein YgiQ